MRNELFPFWHIQQYTDTARKGDKLRWIRSDRKTAVHTWHTLAGIKQHLYTISLAYLFLYLFFCCHHELQFLHNDKDTNNNQKKIISYKRYWKHQEIRCFLFFFSFLNSNCSFSFFPPKNFLLYILLWN